MNDYKKLCILQSEVDMLSFDDSYKLTEMIKNNTPSLSIAIFLLEVMHNFEREEVEL